MLNTFENHPIDSFCASSVDYEMLENEEQENKTHLKQLFSTKPVDVTVKTRWYLMTNLDIRDGKFINNHRLIDSLIFIIRL